MITVKYVIGHQNLYYKCDNMAAAMTLIQALNKSGLGWAELL